MTPDQGAWGSWDMCLLPSSRQVTLSGLEGFFAHFTPLSGCGMGEGSTWKRGTLPQQESGMPTHI